jgi:solute carrier family 25 (mitochondrial carnitine/acylcarnitine transporter), member 20/29
VIQEAAGGLCAGVVGTLIGYPLDLVKSRLQTAGTTVAASAQQQQRGILGTLIHIVRNEGSLALYKGVAPPLISLSILNTVTFATYGTFQGQLHARRNTWDIRNSVAGIGCGCIASHVSTVENLVKTQMQLDNVRAHSAAAPPRYSGSWDCVRQLVRQYGLSILYTGHAVNTLRECVFLSTYFGVYEGLRGYLSNAVENYHQHLSGSSKPLSAAWTVPVAGGLSGATAWVISFPLDCIRAGVQGQDLWGLSRLSAVQVYRQLWATKGIQGLYAGVTPSLVRAFLVSGSRFSAYEFALWVLRGGR